MEQKVEALKSGVISMLKEKGNGLSFVDLSDIPGFAGDLGMEFGNRNVFFWFHCSAEAIAAISQLVNEKQIELGTTFAMTYHADGCIPGYPVGDLKKVYKRPHWHPTEIIKGASFEQ